MSQVSKKIIDKKLEERINQVLWKSLARLSNPTHISVFLNDLLSPTEKTMIAKRLAIAILISKGWLQESIEDSLKVSSATIQSVKRAARIDGRGYGEVIRGLQDDEDWQVMTDDFQQLLHRTFTSRASNSLFVKGFTHDKIKRKEII